MKNAADSKIIQEAQLGREETLNTFNIEILW